MVQAQATLEMRVDELTSEKRSVDLRSHNDVRQYISFSVGTAYYAVDIMSVREIKGWSEVTVLPNQPDYVRGVLNLRGAVLPIVDLSRRLGGKLTEANARHVIVIVSIGSRQIGLLVDAVSDILSVPEGEVKPVPETTSRRNGEAFIGFFTQTEQMVALLNLKNLLENQISDDLEIPEQDS